MRHNSVELRSISHIVLPGRPVQAIEWCAARSHEEVTTHRADTIFSIEEADRRMRQSGLCEEWFAGADVATRQVAGGANGHLFQTLLKASGYHDVACVDSLREGRLDH